jgi:hypothetical protein
VWGINPANGNFFVGTKSVFNKVKIKINHTHEEIDRNHQGEVAEILHACFNHLPYTEYVNQGDFLGFGGSDEYTPNTITYKFPEVVSQRIIIAPHTCYHAENDLRDAHAFPDHDIWDDTYYVKFVKPKAYIQHGQESFADVEEVCNFAKQMAQCVPFVSDKEAVQIKKQLNACIRENRPIEDDAFDCDYRLIAYWKLIKTIKEDCLYLCRNDGPDAYINQDRIDAEGYVMTNKFGTYKLVNRRVFSYANFLNNNKK